MGDLLADLSAEDCASTLLGTLYVFLTLVELAQSLSVFQNFEIIFDGKLWLLELLVDLGDAPQCLHALLDAAASCGSDPPIKWAPGHLLHILVRLRASTVPNKKVIIIERLKALE